MPEGHSIHRIARQFSDTFVGGPVRASSPQGRFAEGAALIDAAVPVRSFAHGKHFFLDFDNDLTLNVHLGMYGAWTFGGDERFAASSSIGAPRRVGEVETAAPADGGAGADAGTGDDDGGGVPPSGTGTDAAGPPEPRPTTRLRLVAEHGWADLVGATTCRVLTPEEVARLRGRLGPDPLDPEADGERFLTAAARTSRPIGVVLMDQSVVAGIGNIFRAESLFRCRIDPNAPAAQLQRADLNRLWVDNVVLMAQAVELGRIVTTAPEHRPGVPPEQAWPEHANYVYHRQGQFCRVCGQPAIVVEELAARKLYWCTVCQSRH